MLAKSPKRILRDREVRAKTGLPPTTRNEYINKGEFPAPIKLGKRSVGWIEEEIDRWIDQRVAASRQGSAA